MTGRDRPPASGTADRPGVSSRSESAPDYSRFTTLAAMMPIVAAALLGDPNPRLSTEASWRYGSKGSLVVDPHAGVFYDFEAGIGGGVIGLVNHVRRVDQRKAVAFIRRCAARNGEWRGSALERITRPRRSDRHHQEKRIADALTLWRDGQPVSGTPAEAYLTGRGLRLPPDADGSALRFLRRCPYQDRDLPCLLALLRDATTGEPCGIQRTPIALDGSGRAVGCDGEKLARRMMGRAAGAVVMLTDAAGDLGIAEGVEDALWLIADGRGPVWATCGTAGMRNLPVLGCVARLTIFADHDAPGIAAATAVKQRYVAADRIASIVLPPRPGGDFADQ